METYNFGAGPGMLPLKVVDKINKNLFSRPGESILELSHRSKDFMRMVYKSELDLRTLLKIPDDYEVLFCSGGSRAQFAMVPLNLLGNKPTADYVLTGVWSKIAFEDANQYVNTNIAATGEYVNFKSIPSLKTWQIHPDAAYLHYTDNETANGVEFLTTPEVMLPMVCDMSSSLLTKKIDITKYNLIYAGAQKNLGVAGITVVIVRKDCLRQPPVATPILYNYSILAKKKSLINTPATFSWYVLSLMLEWYLDQGGVEYFSNKTRTCANKLYSYLDDSDFYYNDVSDSCRSRVNIVFKLKETKLEDEFLKFMKSKGIIQLEGHKAVGGMRASLLNAMPEKGVDALITYMQEFEKNKG